MIADTYDITESVIETTVEGTSIPFHISSTSPTLLNLNLNVSCEHLLRFWGQLLTNHNLPLYKVQVELLEVQCNYTQYTFKKIAETRTDKSGFYYFENITPRIHCYFLKVTSPHNTIHNTLLASDLNPCLIKQAKHCTCCQAIQALNHLSI